MIAERETAIEIEGKTIGASLSAPQGAAGLVIFAHGSGSSRHSPRNRFVARALNHRGLATLLLDLLTGDEEELDNVTAAVRFDIGLLAHRVNLATTWCRAAEALQRLPIGYFGASTGAAAALVAAASRDDVGAIVSRGGRPDLAGDALAAVRAPTLLIVGELDTTVLELNRSAAARMRAPCEISVVPRATHLFVEPGTLEEVAGLAQTWFVRYLLGA